MCAPYVHICVSAPGHVSAPVCAQMHMYACAQGHSKIGCDVYFAFCDSVSHWYGHRCTCVCAQRAQHDWLWCLLCFFCDRVSHWSWAHWLGKISWLLSPQESTCLALPRAGLTRIGLSFFMSSGLKLRSSCLQGIHFTDWALTLPFFFFF